MKTNLFSFLAVAAVSLCAMCISACNENKLNPKEEGYASADFSLKVTEVRHSKTFVWEVAGNKIAIDPSEQELQELWITKWNTTTVTALPKDEAFEGVNYSSSDPKIVKVSKIDETACQLEYVADSGTDAPVTITAKAGTFVHTFQVYAKEVIRIEGVEFFHDFYRDGNEVRCVAKAGVYDPNAGSYKGLQNVTSICNIQPEWNAYEKQPIHIRIGKLVPENASFRYVVRTQVEEHRDVSSLSENFFYDGPQNKDFSEFQGKETDMNRNYSSSVDSVIAFFFNVKTIAPEKKENYDCGCVYNWFRKE